MVSKMHGKQNKR